MNKEEKERVRDLLKKWLEEASKIRDTNNQPTKGGRLDNGNSGEYTKLTKKYILEVFRYYVEENKLLKRKDIELYNYIKEVSNSRFTKKRIHGGFR